MRGRVAKMPMPNAIIPIVNRHNWISMRMKSFEVCPFVIFQLLFKAGIKPASSSAIEAKKN